MKRFLDLADFNREEILDLLALAQSLQDHPQPHALAGKILGLVFMNPSLRTLASFQAGMARLGGNSFVIVPGQGTWQLETRLNAVMNGAAAEHVREGIPVLASYCDALGVRAFADGKNLESDLDDTLFKVIDNLCDKPLINLESAISHPCQALADWRTMDELRIPKRAKFVLNWVYHPKALPFAVAAIAGASVVYAKEWGSSVHYGDAEADGRLRAEFLDWCVRERWFAGALADAKLMHCLPVRRNVAVVDEVLDGPRAVVKREALNRMVVQMAVLHRMLA